MYTNIYLIFKQNINMSISEHLTHEKKEKEKYIYIHTKMGHSFSRWESSSHFQK